jgi:hypothetical protein
MESETGPVVVLETNNTIQLAMARGLLDEAEIPYNLNGQIATLVTDVDPMLHKWVRIEVPADCEEEALEALAPVLNATS